MARPRRWPVLVLALLVAALVWSFPGRGQQREATDAAAGPSTEPAPGEWRAYGAVPGSTRFLPLDQVNRDTVQNLQVAWTWKFDNYGTPAETSTTQTTPIMVNGVLYFTAGQRRTVVAADAGTGETLWVWRPDEAERFDRAPRKVHRGVAYWTDGRDERIVYVTPGFQLVSLDAKTGRPAAAFGRNGIVDLFTQLELDVPIDPIGTIGNSSPVVIANDVIVVGPAFTPGGRVNKSNIKGDVMAFDARTGQKLWTFHSIPRKGEPGYETWLDGSADYTGNAGVWGPFSADPELGYVYLPIEAPTNDVYGGHRPGDNLYSSSLVCLDIRTGRMIWYQQFVRHDIWDYDNPAHPMLLDVTVDGRRIPVVVSVTKQAIAYVMDRRTGEPVWPWEDRPVPQTDVPGEWTAATQPYPTKPPPFDVHGIGPDDLIDFTPAMRAEALEAIKAYTIGPIYTPPTVASPTNRGTIVVPGLGGGANWHSGAADPEMGYVFVGSTTSPTVIGLNPNDPESSNFDSDYTMAGGATLPSIQGLRLMKPPYGRITAYDMNRGEIAWQIPNGDTPPNVRDNPALAGLVIPPTGSASQAGLVVTRSLLFAGEGPGGQAIFHAYDKATGAEVWRSPLPGPQTALPMTYMHQGRQFIVVGVRGGGGVGAQLVAFALPQQAGPGRGGRGGGGRAGGAGQ
jgi:quinoprotein glucose dehydrogenase